MRVAVAGIDKNIRPASWSMPMRLTPAQKAKGIMGNAKGLMDKANEAKGPTTFSMERELRSTSM